MSTHKTQIDLATAEHFVREKFHVPSIELERVSDGETAEAFFFETQEGPRVLRVNSKSKFGFQKDQIAQTHFASEAIPIPKIFEIGEIESGLFFAVSERAPGKTLDKFSPPEIGALMPKIVVTLDAIHSIPPMGEGYGNWDLNGKGKSPSWHKMLEEDLHLDDDETISASFYDAALAATLRKEIESMLDVVPEERKLVHWDYGFNNTLSDGNDITGVIDWEHSGYGDPLHDVAWLDFWNDKQGFAEAIRQYYVHQDRDVPHFDERLVCYKLLIGLGSLGFFAKSRQEEKYTNTKGIISRISR